MKVILSRKGFDSAAGGGPSPILPDGTLLSLPIPSSGDRATYKTVKAYGDKSLFDVLADLFPKKKDEYHRCHLDPDLYFEAISRKANWLPCFGQSEGAQTHLTEEGVGRGDLFLFFGWFRQTELVNDSLQFVRGSPDLHLIWGYLEVGEILKVDQNLKVPKWLEYHPHCEEFHRRILKNSIYLAAPNLSFESGLPGGGRLSYSSRRVLTKKGFSRSRWDLDEKIFKRARISFHDPKSWKGDYFQSRGRGQEFVIQENAMVQEWAKKIIL